MSDIYNCDSLLFYIEHGVEMNKKKNKPFIDSFNDKNVQRTFRKIGYANNIINYLSSLGMDEKEQIMIIESCFLLIADKFKMDIKGLINYCWKQNDTEFKIEKIELMKKVFDENKEYIQKVIIKKQIS